MWQSRFIFKTAASGSNSDIYLRAVKKFALRLFANCLEKIITDAFYLFQTESGLVPLIVWDLPCHWGRKEVLPRLTFLSATKEFSTASPKKSPKRKKARQILTELKICMESSKMQNDVLGETRTHDLWISRKLGQDVSHLSHTYAGMRPTL